MAQAPMTVLVIEDDPTDTRSVDITLAAMGARNTRLLHVTRLQEARHTLKTEASDVIL